MNSYFLRNRLAPFFISLFSVSMVLLSTSAIVKVYDNKTGTKNTFTDSLPHVFNENNGDLVESNLRHEAILRFPFYQLTQSKVQWESDRVQLKNRIIKITGALISQKLPLNIKETGSIQMKGYSIKNIAFQTRPGIYATANLYIPEGKAFPDDKAGQGKFPGVIVMMGHYSGGRLYDKYQSVGITLALNGYVSLCIDPWGSGERTTIHGVFEDHGDENNLGMALMNIGESLMGIQITDNIRGVDLLCSLPYVDRQNIGATGSSGGGNQTMWLTALDERVKAAVPVVSAGTFEAYVMGSPCICEVLTDGLTFTEEAAVLALIAPRAIKMCNHRQDANAAFYPREMLRSYKNAKPVFEMLGAENNIAYDLFNLSHGYWPEDRESMLGWFDLHLKGTGTGASIKEKSFKTLPDEQIMVYAKGKRDPAVLTTEEFCKRRGNELRTILLNTKSFNIVLKRNELRNILRATGKSNLSKVHEYAKVNGWSRIALESSDDKLIPVLLHAPPGKLKEFVIICNPAGKENISLDLVREFIKSGTGIAIVDLSGTGENGSASLNSNDSIGRLRTLTKSYLLLGKTVMGEWIKELSLVTRFIGSRYKATNVSINGSKEAGLAGLYLAALEGNIGNVTLEDAPVSYLFDNRDAIEFFSTGIHLPRFLNWGDISLATALSGKNITFINPVTMSGQKISGDRLKACIAEFEQMRIITRQTGKTLFK
ncbi:MAG: prolyl oligopeptidase family serine peptidase [Ferruginibacter sp.]